MATKRRGMSKRFRFELFKRDGFTCQYCGRVPPAVTLVVDHIIPVSKNGSNELDNLVTACFDCNAGKADKELNDKYPKPGIYNSSDLKERHEQYKEYQKYTCSLDNLLNKDIDIIHDLYQTMYPTNVLEQSFIVGSLRRFIRELGFETVYEAMGIAGSKKPNNPNQAVRYFCGICWNKIKDRNSNT